MFSTILKYELNYWRRQPGLYLYFAFLFGAAFLGMAGAAGAFDAHSAANVSTEILNSPIKIFQVFSRFNLLLAILLPGIIGMSVYRDFRHNVHTLLFVFPLQKADYLWAKFISSFSVVLILGLAIGAGFIIGENLPAVNPSLVGPTRFSEYGQLYFVFVLPNLLFYSAVVFATVALSRNIYTGFIAVLLLLMAQILTGGLLKSPDQVYFAALLDPTGETAVGYATRYWTAAESNTLLLPVNGVVLLNRLLWLLVSFFIFGGVLKYFSFSQNGLSPFPRFLQWVQSFKNKKSKNTPSGRLSTEAHLPRFDHSFLHHLRTAWKLSVFEFRFIIANWSFISLVTGGGITVTVILLAMDPPSAGKTLPLTWQVLRFPTFFFSGVIHLLTFLYAGMLAQRSRSARIDQLVDVTPVPDWVLLVSKWTALLKMQALLLFFILIGGILTQIYQGFYQFDPGHYLFELYVIQWIHFAIWALAAVFVQTLFTNPFLGLFFLVAGMLAIKSSENFGITGDICRFNEPSAGLSRTYSDLDGHGPGLARYFIYKLYWLFFGLILLCFAGLFWVRGLPQSFYERLQIARSRLNAGVATGIALLFMSFLGTGFFIRREENHPQLKRFFSETQNLWAAANEKGFKKFESAVQPQVVAVRLHIDLYPEPRLFKAGGEYTLVNRSGKTIDTLVVSTAYGENTAFGINRPFNWLSRDTFVKTNVLLLRQGLLPGDSLLLRFRVWNQPVALFQEHSRINGNGTFLHRSVFPVMGYRPVELTDPVKRKKYGLPARKTALLPTPEDTVAIDFEAIVSTSADQTAVAPGYLQRAWTEGGRRYFHYKTDTGIKPRYAVHSGRYAVKRDKWKDVSLQIYYHKDHPYNLGRILAGLKASLDYCTRHFSPYSYREIRIVAFPIREGTYATLQANTIPMSESYFITDVDDETEEAIDYPFYITAHEIAHHWWGGLADPGEIPGAKMFTEGLAEYVALKTLENAYGKPAAYNFLRQDLDLYLKGRTEETGEEMPLLFSKSHQDYINYRKAALAFYLLSDYIGETRFNAALRGISPSSSLPVSQSLLTQLRQQTPDTLQYLIRDLFETITLYDNRMMAAVVAPLPDGKYQVDLEILVSKYRSDGKGNRLFADSSAGSMVYQAGGRQPNLASLPLEDYIEIGIFGKTTSDGRESPTELYLERHKVTAIHNKVRIIVDQLPAEAGIDPFIRLIDADIKDNRQKIKIK